MTLSPRVALAIASARVITRLMRFLGRGGTSLPGRIALKISPTFFEQVADRFVIIIVTGTNGKTTTSRMIARLLELAGIGYRTNKSGANLSSGIAGTLSEAVNLLGRQRVKYLLLETDEAAVRKIAPALRPKAIVVSNFFRDQLDRYGELRTTVRMVREGIEGSPDSILIFNADDSLSASLSIDLSSGEKVNRRLVPYGISSSALQNYKSPNKNNTCTIQSDAPYCIRCSARYTYTAVSYGHLGHFRCQSCGYARPTPLVSCAVLNEEEDGSQVEFSVPGGAYQAKIGLPGLYNVYNALSAAALGLALDLPAALVAEALLTFEHGFGRMESFCADGRTIKIILVKNPTGFNLALKHLETLAGPVFPAFMINDKLADGTDISWLWDVDFENFSESISAANAGSEDSAFIAVSGIRAYDMALRLKYSGTPESLIFLNPDPVAAFDKLLSLAPKGAVICLMPTYTVLLELRDVLAKRYKLKEFWE